MCVEPEARDDFERELSQALEPLPAPPGMKRRLMQRREAQYAIRRRRVLWWQRMAVAAALLCVLAGVLVWRNAERRREGEDARRQVILALRITSRALNQMRSQLAAHNQNELNREHNQQE
jgi:hypothetical protein